MKLLKNWYWKGWFILIEQPKMKWAGGAVWPIVRIKDKDFLITLKHEKAHLFSQLSIGIPIFLIVGFFLWPSPWIILAFFLMSLPWLALYLVLHLIYGYSKNPLERYAEALENAQAKWRWFGFVKYFNGTADFNKQIKGLEGKVERRDKLINELMVEKNSLKSDNEFLRKRKGELVIQRDEAFDKVVELEEATDILQKENKALKEELKS